MNSIDTRPPFFPNTKTGQTKVGNSQSFSLKRNDPSRVDELNAKTSDHAKVSINEPIKDFSRIKKAVDTAPEVDNSDRIAALKAQINAGTYNIDYDALADKMLESEF